MFYLNFCFFRNHRPTLFASGQIEGEKCYTVFAKVARTDAVDAMTEHHTQSYDPVALERRQRAVCE